ncbi:MAG: hypothetical protein STHCBS139747_006491 [Sporothrix thermara]
MDSSSTGTFERSVETNVFYDEFGAVKDETREQPWTSLIDEIEEDNKVQPDGKDNFPCADGFYAHSLAA